MNESNDKTENHDSQDTSATSQTNSTGQSQPVASSANVFSTQVPALLESHYKHLLRSSGNYPGYD